MKLKTKVRAGQIFRAGDPYMPKDGFGTTE